jgi:GDP-4-dehydro-6-deoxy-D-mannose reductase
VSARALVTGGAGFVGQWLARALLRRGHEVTSVGLHEPEASGPLTDDERRAVSWRRADLRDAAAVAAVLDDVRPDMLVHLAAVSFVPDAAASSAAAYETNVLGLARLLEALRPRRAAGAIDPLVLVVGSGEQYGRHDDADLPLHESAEQRPLTVYAASKAAQEQVALQAHRGEGVRVLVTRSFNHSGPGQSPRFLLPALVRRALDLRAGGSGSTLPLGNATPVRDFLHVEDVAEAYCLLLERGTAGEAYNVASGVGTSVRELASAVLQRAGVTVDISTDPALVRPVDLPALVGSPDKLIRATGWQPRHSRDDIIDDLLRSAHASTF